MVPQTTVVIHSSSLCQTEVSPPPQHVDRRSEKVTHLSYFFVSQDLSLLFSYFLNAGGEREKERKRKQKSSPWRIQFSRITLLLRPLRGSLPRTACGFQHNICTAPALCQL